MYTPATAEVSLLFDTSIVMHSVPLQVQGVQVILQLTSVILTHLFFYLLYGICVCLCRCVQTVYVFALNCVCVCVCVCVYMWVQVYSWYCLCSSSQLNVFLHMHVSSVDGWCFNLRNDNLTF